MSTDTHPTQPDVAAAVREDAARNESARSYSMAVYIAYLVGLIVPLGLLVGVIVAYVKRGDMVGTLYREHMDRMINTFWISLGLYILAILTAMIGIGVLIAFASWFWLIYRVIRGFIHMREGRSY